MRWMLWFVLFAAPAAGATLEDLYGDCSNSACDANACPIETKILDRGTALYTYPSPATAQAIAAAVDLLIAEDPVGADGAAAAAGYQVTPFFDDVRMSTYHLLEPIGANPGHGTFVFNLSGDRTWLIEAPHVGFDTRTVDFGIALFGGLRAFALLIPGADRYTNYNCNGCSTRAPS